MNTSSPTILPYVTIPLVPKKKKDKDIIRDESTVSLNASPKYHVCEKPIILKRLCSLCTMDFSHGIAKHAAHPVFICL